MLYTFIVNYNILGIPFSIFFLFIVCFFMLTYFIICCNFFMYLVCFYIWTFSFCFLLYIHLHFLTHFFGEFLLPFFTIIMSYFLNICCCYLYIWYLYLMFFVSVLFLSKFIFSFCALSIVHDIYCC